MTTEEKLKAVREDILKRLGNNIYPTLFGSLKEELRRICIDLQNTFFAYDTLLEEKDYQLGIVKLPPLPTDDNNGPEWGNN